MTPTAPVGAPRPTTQREETIALLFSFWLFAGGAMDVWAHTNVIKTLEGFITPYHAVMYSGFVATATWTVILARRRRHEVRSWWRDGWPTGYRLGAVGALMVAAGGMADGIWHSVFGIESGLDAKLSPSHNVVLLGSVLLGTSPLRSWWASEENGWRAVTGVVSLTFASTMGTHLFTVLSAFGSAAPTQPYLHDTNGPSETAVIAGYNGYVLTTVTVLLPLMLALRRRIVPGMVTAVVTMTALFEMVRYEFPEPQLTAAVLAVVGAALADVVLLWLDSVRGPDAPLRLLLAGAVVPVLVWSGHLLGLELAQGVRWPVELWTGTITVTGGIGALLGALASRPARSDRPYPAPSAAPAAEPEPAPEPAPAPAG